MEKVILSYICIHILVSYIYIQYIYVLYIYVYIQVYIFVHRYDIFFVTDLHHYIIFIGLGNRSVRLMSLDAGSLASCGYPCHYQGEVGNFPPVKTSKSIENSKNLVLALIYIHVCRWVGLTLQHSSLIPPHTLPLPKAGPRPHL